MYRVPKFKELPNILKGCLSLSNQAADLAIDMFKEDGDRTGAPAQVFEVPVTGFR